MNRRYFLKVEALTGGDLLIGIGTPALADTNEPDETYTQLSAFLKIGKDSSIHVMLSKAEMGQGVWMTLPMLIAEELDCDLNKIKIETGLPGQTANFTGKPVYRSTGGSGTAKQAFDRYRQAGAVARTMLVTAAARKMGVSPADCRTQNGWVICGTKYVRYGEVASEAALLPVPEVTLREPKNWKYIGPS
ncbi:molybdopterin cofactor-binding domain-containing protein [Arsenicibacter rosenii]|uniref:Aldehyde oxidase/xanthine dehydrogenase second molybdopterin binding domain-containing protein n=1 Tax=Arsenicibacter rosenii TaxID=1750698 RepID=A0A1S2VBG1_9BACT|nr:molybdopterin cofactor-binding domain-containing protein [Arsenicibacter rosenii]OIN55760.1 hypothetical protein BLX24_28295 [Arsenicibacter rosenii]